MNTGNLLHLTILQDTASLDYRDALCRKLLVKYVSAQRSDLTDNEPTYTTHRVEYELQPTLST